MSEKLPTNPSLENLKNQAKALLKAHKQSLSQANSRIQEFHPEWSRSSLEQIQDVSISLSDAQWVIAREYGFDSWAKLKDYIESQIADSGSEIGVNRRDNMETFENPPGWRWVISPDMTGEITMEHHHRCIAAGGIVMMGSLDSDGSIMFHLAHADGKEHHDYSAVVFDAEGERYPLSIPVSGSYSGRDGCPGPSMCLFGGHLDDSAPPFDKVSCWGLEVKGE